ncbi:MAG: glutamine--fructose-6-phosphate transaminase (isomerizing), partial [Eubacterium sp.]|nr:glutamine--fructose-6-phosphate transaminase (isomerizing) [Eubacterium sp.]
MCGIVGYIGGKKAAPILLDGLSKLEYRGYDSAGIAVRDGEKKPTIVKAEGKLRVLAEMTADGESVRGHCGIGHTRWATHGEPSKINAHPHHTDDNNVVGVHNGIIENYKELQEKLKRHDYTFYSETDTEVAIKLIDYYYKKYQMGPIDALAKTMVRIRGSYALVVMFADYPGEIYVARKDSPMILGLGEDENFIASDVPAILKYTRRVQYIGNLEMGRVTSEGVTFFDLNGDEIEKPVSEIEWDTEAAEKGGYEHFMMKEIHEQPRVVADTIRSFISGEAGSYSVNLTESGLSDDEIKNCSQIFIVACGSAYHVGVSAQYIFEDLARIPVRVELASEFRYRNPILPEGSLVIIISQSGETADSLAALRESKEQGIKTLAVVNVVGSSIAREADYVCYTLAGPEIAVATTKAYSTQLIVNYLLAIRFAFLREKLTAEQVNDYIEDMLKIPDKIQKVIDDKERLQWFAAKYANAKDVFFIGRGMDYAICLEGSLKMKEISYVHSEAYAAGELKHGTISLIEDGVLV